MVVQIPALVVDTLSAMLSLFFVYYFLQVQQKNQAAAAIKKFKSDPQIYKLARLAFSKDFLAIVILGAIPTLLRALFDIIFLLADHIIPALKIVLLLTDLVSSIIAIYYIYKLYKKWEQQ